MKKYCADCGRAVDKRSTRCRSCCQKGKLNHSYGKTPSDESRRRQSEIMKGEKNPNYGKRGEEMPNYGKHLSDEHKKKISGSNKGKKRSDETKQKLSDIAKNRKVSKETKMKMSASHKGEKNHNYGKKMSDGQKEKISESRKGKYGGKNNPNYNPNITDEERRDKRKYTKYYEWRISVYEKDNYTCQKCGDNKGGNLNAHHIESYNNNTDLRTTLSNGITLCKTCHKDFHHQYGYGDNTKEQLVRFLVRIEKS